MMDKKSDIGEHEANRGFEPEVLTIATTAPLPKNETCAKIWGTSLLSLSLHKTRWFDTS